MVTGFSFEEILHEALVAPRRTITPLPDTQIIERPGWWQIITPSLTEGGLNEVACSELPEDTADAIIDETVEQYTRLNLRFRWTVPNGRTKPVDLAERLARRGLIASGSLVMARSTADAPSEYGSLVTVEETTLANVDDFTHVMAEGWGGDPAPLDKLHRRMLSSEERRHHLFIARYDGTAAAAAAYVALGHSAYLIGAVALPTHRRRGLYSALVTARLRHAEARGITLATSVARTETSAPILTRCGFETICTMTTFMNR
jgi:GNAT superfamily N-acetyltransferase